MAADTSAITPTYIINALQLNVLAEALKKQACKGISHTRSPAIRLPAPARQDLGHGIACLPNPHQLLAPHTTCVILGWGKKRPSDVHGTRILHEAQVSTIQQGVCRRSYWQYAITDNMVCAGRGRRDSCAGDSGGPLLCRDRSMRYYLQGITSFGDGCGKRGKYGIYTRTANYVPWMRAVMSKNYFDD
ncbi:unnamed protein product [Pieris macdunnoughi]|uniref:Peptidase S1 domain-containing protein n=1 Tax=Pieris macdunnoughi TaxID=345717 RepID=A0A821N0K8_9NEOP|nr:unnamed protein product [Pieris macdunnoughi]